MRTPRSTRPRLRPMHRASYAVGLAIMALFSLAGPALAAPRSNVSSGQGQQPRAKPIGTVHLTPGQEVVISAPLANDPLATLHISLSKPASVTHHAPANVALAGSVTCVYGISERVTEYDVYGVALFWYQISADFCYNGTNVTYIKSPPPEQWWTCCFWGLNSHHAWTNGVNTPYGQSHGCGNFGGPFWQTKIAWVLINEYGYGAYTGSGGDNASSCP